MRYLICLAAALWLFVMTTPSLAGPGIPDLKGTWIIRGSGIGHEKPGGTPPGKLHITKLRPAIEVEYIMVIDDQDGFRFSGYTESSRKRETISGVVGFDNETVYIVDNDGMHMARLVSPDKMEAVYLHNTKDHSIASRDIITRKR